MIERTKQPKISQQAWDIWESIAERLTKELRTKISVSKAIEIIGGREANKEAK